MVITIVLWLGAITGLVLLLLYIVNLILQMFTSVIAQFHTLRNYFPRSAKPVKTRRSSMPKVASIADDDL